MSGANRIARHSPRSLCVSLVALSACAAPDSPALGAEVVVASAGATNPTVAVDPASDAYFVAWVGVADSIGDVYVARSEDGSTFAAPVRANDVPGDAAPHEQAPAQVAVGPDGAVYVLWQNNRQGAGRRFPYSDLRFVRSPKAGRGWSTRCAVDRVGWSTAGAAV